eukprot:43613-Pelagomonas_calceolata.AAC.2
MANRKSSKWIMKQSHPLVTNTLLLVNKKNRAIAGMLPGKASHQKHLHTRQLKAATHEGVHSTQRKSVSNTSWSL